MKGHERAEREKTWGTRVLERRTILRVSQQALADACGVTQQTISSIERGESTPRITTARKIARALGTTLEELFPMSSAPDGDE